MPGRDTGTIERIAWDANGHFWHAAYRALASSRLIGVLLGCEVALHASLGMSVLAVQLPVLDTIGVAAIHHPRHIVTHDHVVPILLHGSL